MSIQEEFSCPIFCPAANYCLELIGDIEHAKHLLETDESLIASDSLLKIIQSRKQAAERQLPLMEQEFTELPIDRLAGSCAAGPNFAMVDGEIVSTCRDPGLIEEERTRMIQVLSIKPDILPE